MSEEHNHEDYFEKIPHVKNYFTWLTLSGCVGASIAGTLEHFSDSGLISILGGVFFGFVSGVAVFSSSEYEVQRGMYESAKK